MRVAVAVIALLLDFLLGKFFALNFRFKLMADDVKIVILEHT
jgi:hypothetical protein